MQPVEVLKQLEKGDKVLYNEKKTPLTVASVDTESDEVVVQGPQGGEYLLFVPADNEELVLESRSGNREYANKVEDLRTVGEWVQTGEDRWEHSVSGATVELVQNDTGYWTVSVTGVDGDLPDIPRYGFTEKRFARETAEAFIADNPEG